MTELTLAEALEEIRVIQQTGSRVGMCGMRSGRVIVDFGGVLMGTHGCPICGGVVNMGHLLVKHDDGRSVTVDMTTFHNIQAGHAIPDALAGTLIDIVADR